MKKVPESAEERYRAFYRKTPAMLHSIDERGRLVEVSDRWLRVLGYERDEVLGRRATDFLTEESRRHAETVAIPEFLSTGSVEDVDYRFVCKDGRILDIRLSAMAEFDDKGKLVRSLAVLTDLTARRRAEREVRRFREIIDRVGDAVFVVDAETGRFRDCNTTALERLGYTRDELLELTVDRVQVGYPLKPPEGLRPLVERARREKGFFIQGLHRRKDGSTFPAETSVSLHELPDRTYLLAIARDVTDRNELEAQLRQAQKMEAIGNLTAGIAHNFNNMLMIILGSIELAMAGGSAEIRAKLGRAESTTRRAADMVAQLLAYSYQGEQPEPELVDVAAVLRDVADLCRKTFDRRIAIEVRATGGLPRVLGDRNQLLHVFMNLSLNARDALEGITTPQLQLETDAVMLTSDPATTGEPPRRGQYVRARIVDNGVGMAAATRERVFDPFFTTKEVDRGTGLGLSTASGIVRQHQGWIECDSAVGSGTTFSVYFPVASQGERSRPAEPLQPPEPAAGEETILLVEDEDQIRSLVQSGLQHSGYSVLTAEDGIAALELFDRYRDRIQLVLLDLSMPKMSGHDVLRALRERDPDGRVIVLTGHKPEPGELPGIAGVVSKPVGLGELARRVRKALDG